MQYWCLPVSPSTSGANTRITLALFNDCLSLAKRWKAPHSLHSLSLVSVSKSMCVWKTIPLLGLATALQPAVRELHPPKVHEFRFASSLHISYLPLALCSEQAGLSPSQYEQPCSPIEFHQNPGHLPSGKGKWHCVAVRNYFDWARKFSASVLAFTQLTCITPTAQLDNSPLEPHNASGVSRLRRPHAVGPQCAAVQLCSAW